ncbi:MAG: T9SS type A sorting domain-containing protein, partial [Candidatus Krumholzibacteria bacterium]
LLQDNFASDGTLTGTVRIDMAKDLNPDGSPEVRPGDSLAVTVFERVVGLDYHISGDPLSGPAVYCHVKDVSSIKSGEVVSGDVGRWPVVAADGEWTVLRMDEVETRFGDIIPERYCVDLNDDLYTPGDTIWYYLSARDASGITTYWSRFTGITKSEAEVRSLLMEVTCLPANARSGATDILYVDNFDNLGAQPYFDTAFEILGLQPDRYDMYRSPFRSGSFLEVDSGPASRVVSVTEQLISSYRLIIWNSGDLIQGLIGDGTSDPSKPDDFGLLYAFLDSSLTGAGVYISGDNVAQEWAGLRGSSAINFRNRFMNFDLASGDHAAVGEPVAPLVVAQTGSAFSSMTGSASLIAFGGCPVVNHFDVLLPTGTARLEMAYSNNPGHGAVISQETPNAVGDTARVMLSGFSYHEIRDDRVQFPVDRVEHLMAIIRWLGGQVDDPTGIGSTARFENRLAQNYPNPFNPMTTIRYSIREPGHVNLNIYNVAGQLVRALVNEVQAPVTDGFTVTWDATSNSGARVSTGVYFYRLVAGDFSETRKLLVLK